MFCVWSFHVEVWGLCTTAVMCHNQLPMFGSYRKLHCTVSMQNCTVKPGQCSKDWVQVVITALTSRFTIRRAVNCWSTCGQYAQLSSAVLAVHGESVLVGWWHGGMCVCQTQQFCSSPDSHRPKKICQIYTTTLVCTQASCVLANYFVKTENVSIADCYWQLHASSPACMAGHVKSRPWSLSMWTIQVTDNTDILEVSML